MLDKSQVFTPKNVVEKLLDEVGYTEAIFEKKILENSCGSGNILVEIVERYIRSGIKLKKSNSEIKKGLEKNIVAVELDEKQCVKCIERINSKALQYNIYNVNWNIVNGDYLNLKMIEKFDFIIGNPPYISYKDLEVNIRRNLKQDFVSCSAGKFDYCYAFIEKSLSDLNNRGVLSYLIPNSIFKNVFGENLRNIILPSLSKIIDLKGMKIFDDVLTSTAILVCDVSKNDKIFRYIDEIKNKERILKKSSLGNKWVFEERQYKTKGKKFEDYFFVGTSIATQLNRAYLLSASSKIDIEKNLLRAAVSPRSIMNSKQEYIIFPYHFNRGDLIRYSEQEFISLFPKGYRYLKKFKRDLLKRKADKNVKWFEYGRNQAIANMDQEKILMSFIVTNKVKTYLLSKETIPYSGIYITAKSDLTLIDAKEILESSAFFNYVCSVGIPASGKSVRITANDIKNYRF